MAITSRDQLINALANNASRFILDKATVASQAAGGYSSMWRATGQPGQGAIPTTAASPDSTTLGSIGFANQTPPASSYLAYLTFAGSIAGATLEIHDRLAHMGGLVFNSTSPQTTNLPLQLDTLGVPAARYGEANFGDVQWWLEVYGNGGATASNATVNVTFDDNSTGNLGVVAVGGTLAVGRMIPLDILRTSAQQGLNIKGINSVTLSASTGTAGNFGFTCTRTRAALPSYLANKSEVGDWAFLGLPEVANDSCLVPVVLCIGTSTGTVRGQGKIAHG
jgi:hypothetical protein